MSTIGKTFLNLSARATKLMSVKPEAIDLPRLGEFYSDAITAYHYGKVKQINAYFLDAEKKGEISITDMRKLIWLNAEMTGYKF
jgi:hypothetical protein